MSTNGGASWSNISSVGGTQVHPDQHHLTFGPDGTLWVATDGGVWKATTPGASWIDLNHTLSTAQLYTVAVHPTDVTFLISGTQDNGSVAYQGMQAWPQVIGGDGGPVAMAATNWTNPNLYFTTYVYLNPTYRWLRPLVFSGEVTGPWSVGERASWANGPLVTDPNLPDTLLAGTYHLWQTSNSGNSWSSISPDLTGGGHLRSTAIAPIDSNIIYTGSSDGRVFATFDRGATWLNRSAGLPSRPIPDIVISPTDPLTIYACADQPLDGRVFRSSDGGITWQDLTGSLPAGVNGLTLAVDFTNGVIYLGSDGGVYSTPDSGVTWTQEGINLPNVAIYNLRIDTANRLLVAATHGRGMWNSSLTGGPLLSLRQSRPSLLARERRGSLPEQPIP